MLEQVKTTITQVDLQQLEAEDKWIEVEDGELIIGENIVPPIHVIVIRNLFRLLDAYVTSNQLGEVLINGVRYILGGTSQNVQRAYIPDLSFLRAGRIPPDFDWLSDFVGAPDLAVEVASPGQTNALLLRKIARYLEAGSAEAWLIYPTSKTIYQYRPTDEEPNRYGDDALIDTAALFPGLILMTSHIFALPQTK